MRTEFSSKVKVTAWIRADGHCENKKCGAKLFTANVEYHHDIPCELGGNNSIDNCVVLCKTCHRASTSTKDIPRIAKAKRVERKHIGAHKSHSPIRGWRKFNGEPVRNPRMR